MQYLLGACFLGSLEGRPSTVLAIKALEKALELDPKLDEAKPVLEEAKAALAEYDGVAAPAPAPRTRASDPSF